MDRLRQTLGRFAPIPTTKLLWSRVTASRLTTCYLILAIAHCAIQVGLQMTAHAVNNDAANFLDKLITTGGLQSKNFTLYDSNTQTLRSCWGVPGQSRGNPCLTIWSAPSGQRSANAAAGLNALPSSSVDSVVATRTLPSASTGSPSSGGILNNPQDAVFAIQTVVLPVSTASAATATAAPKPFSGFFVPTNIKRAGSINKRHVFVTSIIDATDGVPEVSGLRLDGLPNRNGTVDISLSCVAVLRWPLQRLHDTQREDIVFVVFQVWLLGISMAALLNESIPHVAVSLLTHALASIWSGFQLRETHLFRKNFVTLTVDGACKGVSLLPRYWRDRGVAEISLLALNLAALVLNAILSWRIVKAFGWATFRRIGASRKLHHVYSVVLVMSIGLQISVFFIVTPMALWIDQLCSGPIAVFSTHAPIYRIMDAITILLLVPWVILGWIGIRRENKKMMYIFLGISAFLLSEWATMFASGTWRLTFLTWNFFAVMSVLAAVLTSAVTILGIICFRDFGLGLEYYLSGRDSMDADDFQRILQSDTKRLKAQTAQELEEERISFPTKPAAYMLPAEPPQMRTTGGPMSAAFGQSGAYAPQRTKSVESGSSRGSSGKSSRFGEGDLADTVQQSRWSRDSSDRASKKRWAIE